MLHVRLCACLSEGLSLMQQVEQLSYNLWQQQWQHTQDKASHSMSHRIAGFAKHPSHGSCEQCVQCHKPPKAFANTKAGCPPAMFSLLCHC